MATKIKLREKAEPAADESEAEVHSQRRRPPTHRYLLQVDRQTKASYPSIEAATAAGLVIKTGHPVVQVSVYDTVESTNTVLKEPGAS
jgi:hypothetical protein